MAAIRSNFGMPEHPRHVAYGQAVNVELFVSQGHEFSISIAIPIWISMNFIQRRGLATTVLLIGNLAAQGEGSPGTFGIIMCVQSNPAVEHIEGAPGGAAVAGEHGGTARCHGSGGGGIGEQVGEGGVGSPIAGDLVEASGGAQTLDQRQEVVHARADDGRFAGGHGFGGVLSAVLAGEGFPHDHDGGDGQPGAQLAGGIHHEAIRAGIVVTRWPGALAGVQAEGAQITDNIRTTLVMAGHKDNG